MKVFYIGFTGGEPLVHANIYNILEYASSYKFQIGITTNGTLVTENVAKKLKSFSVDLVRVSLDSHKPDVHDWFRGKSHSFKAACEGIRHLLKEKLNVTVLTVISKHNIADWEEMIKTCGNLGVRALNTYIFVPKGRGEDKNKLALNPQEYKSFLTRVVEIQNSRKNIHLVTDAPLLSVLRESKESGSCQAGMFDLFIKEDGEVTPCPYFTNSIGSIRKKPLSQIWRNSNFLASLRSKARLPGTCKSCDFSESCFGGCRAAAYCAHKTISAPDPNCWLIDAKNKEV